MISENDIRISRLCLDMAIAEGAGAARVSLTKGSADPVTMRNGEIDKLRHSADRSTLLQIYMGGRYGTFSTNRLAEEDLAGFVKESVEITSMLSPDECYGLPSPERTAKGFTEGSEAGLYDPACENLQAEEKMEIAKGELIFGAVAPEDDWKLISEEVEYGDSVSDSYIIDSNGFEGRHKETSFGVFSEVTIESDGKILSGYWWRNVPRLEELERGVTSRKALSRALDARGPVPVAGGRLNIVIDNSCASRLVSPLMAALDGGAVWQKSSFLGDDLGKKVFSENLTFEDRPHDFGKPGARLFDSEGVATRNRAIIENGVVREFFINTFQSAKLGLEGTVEGPSRLCIRPFADGETKKDISLQDILELLGDGMLITGFNGGNCNPTTGDFSYGVEGYAFKDGCKGKPFREAVITGNMKGLWSKFAAAGTDIRPGAAWNIGTLGFRDIDFSA
ncbi:MAG: TldD/PmbA family protein [Bacteroidales bacterium]|nr:TldD/PmbA family protein [Bacteroidales bacterium]